MVQKRISVHIFLWALSMGGAVQGGWLYIVTFPEVFEYTKNPSILIPTTCTFCHFKSQQTFRS